MIAESALKSLREKYVLTDPTLGPFESHYFAHRFDLDVQDLTPTEAQLLGKSAALGFLDAYPPSHYLLGDHTSEIRTIDGFPTLYVRAEFQPRRRRTHEDPKDV
ncbi:hypothetical protein [Paludisphaera rhizosphaerae]|uniref:hypothetical protein n=1 Tax=Paludisphaera rhizosphaerae TaxID=2711216 RepID=UPI0013EB6ECC|nr:hypothetical protein [Paludisphaera rhizosphaerae]